MLSQDRYQILRVHTLGTSPTFFIEGLQTQRARQSMPLGRLFKGLKHLKKKSSTEVCSREVRGSTEAAETFYKPVSTYEMGPCQSKTVL